MILGEGETGFSGAIGVSTIGVLGLTVSLGGVTSLGLVGVTGVVGLVGVTGVFGLVGVVGVSAGDGVLGSIGTSITGFLGLPFKVNVCGLNLRP